MNNLFNQNTKGGILVSSKVYKSTDLRSETSVPKLNLTLSSH